MFGANKEVVSAQRWSFTAVKIMIRTITEIQVVKDVVKPVKQVAHETSHFREVSPQRGGLFKTGVQNGRFAGFTGTEHAHMFTADCNVDDDMTPLVDKTKYSRPEKSGTRGCSD